MDAVADIERGWKLPAEVVSIEFSDHAIEQANLRLFRRLGLDFAARMASQLLPDATVGQEPPEWYFKRKGHADAWLISEDPPIGFPLAKYVDHPGSYYATTATTPEEDHHVGATVRWVEPRTKHPEGE